MVSTTAEITPVRMNQRAHRTRGGRPAGLLPVVRVKNKFGIKFIMILRLETGNFSGTENSVKTTNHPCPSERRFPAGIRPSRCQPPAPTRSCPLFIKSWPSIQSFKNIGTVLTSCSVEPLARNRRRAPTLQQPNLGRCRKIAGYGFAASSSRQPETGSLPAAAQGFVKLHEVQGNGLIALHQRILRRVKRTFGIQYVQKIRQTALVKLI